MSTYAERAATYRITTVQFHRQDDKRIIDWLEDERDISAAIRRACDYYLDHFAGICPAGDTPAQPAAIDPESIRTILDESLLDHLADIRRILDISLADVRLVAHPEENEDPDDELEDMLIKLDSSLEFELEEI